MNTRKSISIARQIVPLAILGSFLSTQCLAAEAMSIIATGQVGIGKAVPTATLDVFGDALTVGTGNAVVRLSKAGGLAFQLDDTTVAGFWNFSNAIGETEFRISKSGTGATELKLTAAGNLTITGQLVTGGPSCGAGCDRVFTPDYQLPSIEAHAEQMWKNQHLPAIGPTHPSKPVNISDQFGNVLNELETAHIYIAQLNDEKETLQTKVESLESRLSEIEALLSK